MAIEDLELTQSERARERQAKRYQHDKECGRELYKLLGNKCSRCGFKNHLALVIHHVIPTGKRDRHFEATRIVQAIKDNPKKISDYKLLCANCHMITHAKLLEKVLNSEK
jgi:predicted HNH restriction endonuclease